MKKTSRRRPRKQLESATVRPEQQTMDDFNCNPSSTLLVQKFALNSYHRSIARKGMGNKPANVVISSNVLRKLSGRKCNNLDLSVLSQSFANYRKVVNLILEKVFSDAAYSDMLGKELEQSRGMVYLVLRKEQRLKWTLDNEFGQLVYERLHRNALETAARIIYAYYTRQKLVNSLLGILATDEMQLLQLMTRGRIPSDLVRRVKDTIGKKSNGSYHYALSACRQVRRVLRNTVCETNPLEEGERRKSTRELLETKSPDRLRTQTLIIDQVEEWRMTGFPFITPTFQKDTMDFAASTENATGQGYWFQQDPEREDEIILYIKTPPGIVGHELDTPSPYKSQTVRLRFLNWFPRKAKRAKRKAKESKAKGHIQRAMQLEYRAARFEDMSQQLVNTIQLHRFTRELSNERAQPEKNEVRINDLKTIIHDLKKSRRSAPPIIKVVGKQATISIPFMPPDKKLLKTTISTSIVRKKSAGVDRGLRHSMVVSVKNGEEIYEETMIGRQELFEKREKLRQQTRVLMSQIARKRNNWEKKHARQQPPAIILKKERELESVWRKIRRLDKEISHQVADETVWFCEQHGVKTIYFEDLRSFQGKGGMKKHSWNLSTNLWGMMIEGVRYRREALGHRNGGVWLVNPAWTSQTCHVCGERGVRVEDETSTIERKGGEYFHCSKCDEHFHADVNAARNIMYVQQTTKPTAVGGRTA
ncbi:MAG: zinc ribbon domain-containing protein, partial [Candidatus Thorarchaeota archaeon]